VVPDGPEVNVYLSGACPLAFDGQDRGSASVEAGSRSFDLADREAFTRSDQPLCTRSTMLSTTNISRSTTCLAFVFPLVLLASACVADDADLEDTTLGDTSSVGDTGSSGSTSPSGS